MKKMLLSSLLQIEPKDIVRWKMRFNKKGGGKTAFECYLNNDETGEFDRMTLWCNERSMMHKGDILIGLARINFDDYLLVKIYEILDEDISVFKSEKRYSFKVLEGYKELFGRVIIGLRSSYDKSYPVRKLEDIEKDPTFEIVEIKSTVVSSSGFKGYDNVSLSYADLKRIVDKKPNDWINALSNQQAVYLITDLKTGQLYVGSATNKDAMLLDRWISYVKNGHGGNKEFKKIINNHSKGFEYIKNNFQYTILENFNSRVDSNYIKEREQYWKKVLDSIKHGLNDN